MHGFIIAEIKKFVDTHLGPDAWKQLLTKAGLESKEYLNFLNYPDGDVVRMVETASEVTETPVRQLLETFGEFLGADLVKVYRPLIRPEWKTLDFLVNTEQTIHSVVRSRNTQAVPPSLEFFRTGSQEVELRYNSKRKMCDLAKGIARGVAGHYGESLTIEEDQCMHDGAASCHVRFLVGPAEVAIAPPATTTPV